MNKTVQTIIKITLLLIILQFFIQSVIADEEILVEFFYNKDCGSCWDHIPDMYRIEEKYRNESVIVTLKDQHSYPNWEQEYEYYRDIYRNQTGSIIVYPFVVISHNDDIKILRKINITIEDMSNIIDSYLSSINPIIENQTDTYMIDFLIWQFNINTSEFSLPVFIFVFAGADSFNPCVFFILIFLLNLLIHARSRRRMILVGSIFIFFSALLYYLFMALLLNAFQILIGVGLIAIVIGLFALTLGIINIKDFFLFKKGLSLSIPESKKPSIYKRMRELVKNPKISGVLYGTIILAILVNFYELICSITLPSLVVSRLLLSNTTPIENYIYILIYCIIYIIPMLVIVSIFVWTLGRRKLTEWHGRILKLLSGIMMTLFGIVFIIDFSILENIFSPILLMILSIILTFSISQIWKKLHPLNEE